MSATESDLAALRAQLQLFADRAELGDLCDRYVRNLDQSRRDHSWLGSVFTDDVQLVFPAGEYRGLGEVRAFQEMTGARAEGSQHLSSNHFIEIDGDQARISAQLVAVHVPRLSEPAAHFAMGGHYQAEAVRTKPGWRIRRFVFDLAWKSGG